MDFNLVHVSEDHSCSSRLVGPCVGRAYPRTAYMPPYAVLTHHVPLCVYAYSCSVPSDRSSHTHILHSQHTRILVGYHTLSPARTAHNALDRTAVVLQLAGALSASASHFKAPRTMFQAAMQRSAGLGLQDFKRLPRGFEGFPRSTFEFRWHLVRMNSHRKLLEAL